MIPILHAISVVFLLQQSTDLNRFQEARPTRTRADSGWGWMAGEKPWLYSHGMLLEKIGGIANVKIKQHLLDGSFEGAAQGLKKCSNGVSCSKPLVV